LKEIGPQSNWTMI